MVEMEIEHYTRLGAGMEYYKYLGPDMGRCKSLEAGYGSIQMTWAKGGSILADQLVTHGTQALTHMYRPTTLRCSGATSICMIIRVKNPRSGLPPKGAIQIAVFTLHYITSHYIYVSMYL